MEVKIYIGSDLIDLKDGEGINMKSTVQDINDISKVFADFTKDFNIPASKNNNKIFKHYYDADINGGFDARTKKSAIILLNDLPYKKGKIRLTGTSLTDNEIVSYKIQFEGDVIKIKDEIGDDKLSSLDLSVFNHDYSSTNIKTGLTSSLFSGSVIYPMISHTRRFLYDSSNSITSNETQTNIHYKASENDDAIDYTDLKPAVKIADIITAIQTKYNLEFVGDFFNRDYFTNLYMWLNNKEGILNDNALKPKNIIDFDSGSSEYIDLSTNILTLQSDYVLFVTRLTVTPLIGYEDIDYTVIILSDGNEAYRRENVTGSNTFSFNAGSDYYNKELTWYVESRNEFNYQSELVHGSILSGSVSTYSSPNLISSIVDISNQMPDLKTFEFLQGILRMFNIALTGNDDGSINWETLPDWYALGGVHKNFEQYIDIDSSNINRGVLKNEFKFSYEKPETILAKQFRDSTGVSYGDLEAKLYDENDVLLDGSKLEIKVPFENMIYERVTDLDTNVLTNIQYGFAVDKELSPVVTKPLLFYNNNTPISNIGFKNDDNTHEAINTSINIPNHCLSLEDNEVANINFGAELSTYNYGVMNQSLYNQFYKDYVNDMFSNQRRVYAYNAIIPAHILTTIKLNDRLIVGNKRYIINSINTNLITQKTKLELLNDIYTSGDLIGNSFVISPQSMNVDKNGGDFSFTIYYNGTTTVTVVDSGDGIFTTETSNTSDEGIKSVPFNVPVNNTGNIRTQQITVNNGTDILTFTIIQDTEVIDWTITTKTFDNNIVTFDNNKI